jgi:long-chain acyl-CoA synthetase
MITTIDRTLTLQKLLENSCSRFAGERALGFVGEEDISYGELKRQVDELSTFLQDQGIRHGDRVAILGENSPQWAIAYFAVTTIGSVAVPILPEFHTSEIHHILRHSEARALFVSERYYHKVEDLDFTSFAFVSLLDTFSVIDTDLTKAVIRRLIAEGSRELRRIRNIALRLVGLLPTDVKPDDTAAIIYTSGTTGHSKGVMLSHRNIACNASAGAIIQPLSPEDRTLSILPLAHVYECTLGLVLPILEGASIYYLRKPPTAAVLLPALERIRPSIILTVPLIIEKIYKTRILPKIQERWLLRKLSSFPALRRKIHRMAGKKLLALFGGRLKFFGIGGAAVSSDVEQFLRDAKFPYAIGYGLTETSPLIAGCGPTTTRFRATGPVAPGAEIRIADPDPVTGVGEVQARGIHIMKGYFRDEERTREAFTEDGWFKTGDLGVFDSDGYLYIKGRLKNMILGPSGENIYPEAVESVINRSPLVLESLVYDDQGSIVARVHLDYEKLDEQFAAENLGETQMRAWIEELLENLRKEVNAQLSSFSRIARIVEQREPFEKTPTQKIKRYLYATPVHTE